MPCLAPHSQLSLLPAAEAAPALQRRLPLGAQRTQLGWAWQLGQQGRASNPFLMPVLALQLVSSGSQESLTQRLES